MKLACNVWGLCYASFPLLFMVSPGSMLSTLFDLQVCFTCFYKKRQTLICSPGSTFVFVRVFFFVQDRMG